MVVPAVEVGANALLPPHASGGWDGALVSGVEGVGMIRGVRVGATERVFWGGRALMHYCHHTPLAVGLGPW